MQFNLRNWKNGVAAFAVASTMVLGSGYAVNAQAEDTRPPRHEEVRTAIAQALGLTLEEMQAQLEAGQTLADLAENAGVALEDLRTLADDVRDAERIERIQASVEAGEISQAQADWMIEGITQGYVDGHRGHRGPGLFGEGPGGEHGEGLGGPRGPGLFGEGSGGKHGEGLGSPRGPRGNGHGFDGGVGPEDSQAPAQSSTGISNL